MLTITLPDNSKRQFDKPVSGFDIATTIGPGLAKAALAMTVDGEQQDLSRVVAHNADITILTANDEAGLDVMRHTTTAQALARAVKKLYPTAKLAIGPTIEHGFYYDIDFETPFSSDDLPKIEAEMLKIIAEDNLIHRELWSAWDVKKYFLERHETYKADIVERAIESGALLEEGKLSVYRQEVENGDDFVDLCRGPHVPSTGFISKAFKLTNLAGAYWRGDSNNAMLTRIYGVSFKTEKELKAHLHMLEEAAKRDHRKIGPALDLFHLQEEAPGQVFWHHKGWQIFLELQHYIRGKLRAYDYQEVNTPQLIKNDLYIASGHWEKFGTENMFLVKEEDGRTYAMKPMNCPCHVQIFNQGIKSYRDLPLRMSEFGTCMRNEAHGALHGLMRVTSMTQDDAHIFCTEEQIENEVVQLCELIKSVYRDMGFESFFVKFSDRPEMRVGSDDVWNHAEQALKNACDKADLNWVLNPGEGAFYGPKLEFVLKDCLGRDWQCGTIQLDFNLPKRLNAEYIDANNTRQMPVMIHRAILGSLERFMGILIENFAGHMPLWLSPVQVVVAGISEKHNDAVIALTQRLKEHGLRAEADIRNEKVSYKVREHSHQKVPVILVLGDREIENDTATVRRLGSQKQETIGIEALMALLHKEIAEKTLPRPQEKQDAA